MTDGHGGYLSPKLEGRRNDAKGGNGVYALEPVETGELLVVWSGTLYDYDSLMTLPEQRRSRCVQVEENLFLVPVPEHDPADFVNHSCDPNAGVVGQIALIALRPIAIGEEVCFDYAMTDGSPYDEFECGCGTVLCRHRVTGNDWKLSELQTRYAGHFSPYIQRRINKFNAN
jgi:hypothetical protein